MAPEQAGGGHGVTTLTDVYALGAILYEVLTGKPPFQTREIDILLAQIRNEEPPPPSGISPDVPRDLELICLKCLAKEPTQRYASAGELADELERWLRGDPVHVRAPGLISRIRLWARHNSRAALWVFVIGVAWGLFGLQLPLALRVYSGPIQRANSALTGTLQSPLPNEPVFWGTYLWLLMLPFAIIIHFSAGMLTYIATRSRGRWAHVSGGVAVGLIGGVIAFTLYIGPAFVLLRTLVPTTADLLLLGRGLATKEPAPPETASPAPQEPPVPQSRSFHERDQFSGNSLLHPQDQLLERQPELANTPEHLRGRLFVAKVRAQNFVGIFEGIGLGMLVTMVTAMPLAIGGAAAAGFAVRRCGSIRAAIPLYLEMFALLSLVVRRSSRRDSLTQHRVA